MRRERGAASVIPWKQAGFQATARCIDVNDSVVGPVKTCLGSGRVDAARPCGVDQRVHGAFVVVSCDWMRPWSFLRGLWVLLERIQPRWQKFPPPSSPPPSPLPDGQCEATAAKPVGQSEPTEQVAGSTTWCRSWTHQWVERGGHQYI